MCFILFFYFSFVVSGECDQEKQNFLLPGNVFPEHYNITLHTYIHKFRENNETSFLYKGIVEISLKVLGGKENVSNIVLHKGYNIRIKDIGVRNLKNRCSNIKVGIGYYDRFTEKQIIEMDPPLNQNGQYVVTISFFGQHTSGYKGFFRGFYLDKNNKRRWYLATHFEAVHARKAFPCFDEPKYKATFELTTVIEENLARKGYTSLFNSHIEKEYTIYDKRVTKFHKTPRPLSTYTVAFVISDFHYSDPVYFKSFQSKNQFLPYRTIGRAEMVENNHHALSQTAGPALLAIMMSSCNVEFSMLKMDQVGLPSYFMGAMENWGLTVYNINGKDEIIRTICHEIAHQWFGNLVTLHWWTDLWLNEGFATFFQYQIPSEMEISEFSGNSWDHIGRQIYSSMQTVLKMESYWLKQPLTYEVYDPDLIKDRFNIISYNKGGAIVRMWYHILGRNHFYRGLNNYLKTRSNNISTPEHLFKSWDLTRCDFIRTLKMPIGDLFREWHLQDGYPLITAVRNGNKVILTQEHFSMSLDFEAPTNYKWHVPISYSSDMDINFDDTQPKTFLLKTDNSTTITLKSSKVKWYILNIQHTYYYRINYDEENWKSLLEEISNPETSIHHYNIAQIISDSGELVRVGKKNVTHLFDCLNALRLHTSIVPWKNALYHIKFLWAQIGGDENLTESLKGFTLHVLHPIFKHLKSKEIVINDDALLLEDVSDLMCDVLHTTCPDNTRSWTPQFDYLNIIVNLKKCTSAKEITHLNQKFRADKLLLKTVAMEPEFLEPIISSGKLKIDVLGKLLELASTGGHKSAIIIYNFLSLNVGIMSMLPANVVDIILHNLQNNLDASRVPILGTINNGMLDNLLNYYKKWKYLVLPDIIRYFNNHSSGKS